MMDEHHRKLLEAANEGCLLRQLPAELRNETYYLVLPTNTVIDTRGVKTYEKPDPEYLDCRHVEAKEGFSEPYWNQVGITQACRALRGESLGIYYGTNTFVVHIGFQGGYTTSWQLDEAKYWIRSRPQLGMAALQEVVLSVPRVNRHGPRDMRHDPLENECCNSPIRVSISAWSAERNRYQNTCDDCMIGYSEDCSKYFEGARGSEADKLMQFISALKADVGAVDSSTSR